MKYSGIKHMFLYDNIPDAADDLNIFDKISTKFTEQGVKL